MAPGDFTYLQTLLGPSDLRWISSDASYHFNRHYRPLGVEDVELISRFSRGTLLWEYAVEELASRIDGDSLDPNEEVRFDILHDQDPELNKNLLNAMRSRRKLQQNTGNVTCEPNTRAKSRRLSGAARRRNARPRGSTRPAAHAVAVRRSHRTFQKIRQAKPPSYWTSVQGSAMERFTAPLLGHYPVIKPKSTPIDEDDLLGSHQVTRVTAW